MPRHEENVERFVDYRYDRTQGCWWACLWKGARLERCLNSKSEAKPSNEEQVVELARLKADELGVEYKGRGRDL